MRGGSPWREYVFIGPSENVRSNCTRTKPEVQPLALKKCHGAIYLHEAPSGPAFGNRDAYVASFNNSYDFCEVSHTHEDIVSLAVDVIEVAVETP